MHTSLEHKINDPATGAPCRDLLQSMLYVLLLFKKTRRKESADCKREGRYSREAPSSVTGLGCI